MKQSIFAPLLSLLLIAATTTLDLSAQQSDFLTVAQDPSLGAIITDMNGMTVYLFTKDMQANQSACHEECAAQWPPVRPTDTMTLPAGLPGTLATIDRPDGTKQATYNGIPLYRFVNDTKPGDASGQGVEGAWFIVPPGAAFGPFEESVGPGMPERASTLRIGFAPEVGPYLTDSAGLTLYIHQKDAPSTSGCTGECATVWPPFAASDSLTLPVGIGGTLTTIKRDDGAVQMAYNDQPLYTFVEDSQPGDITGQNLEDFVVATVNAAATATPPATPDAAVEAIQIKDFAFSPATLQVTTGTTVTWTNGDSTPHTVTSDDGAFDGGNVDPGTSFSFTFTTPGTYPYHCAIHPFMTATIVVT